MRLPFTKLFFNSRITFLEGAIALTVLWIIFGFDSTLNASFSSDDPIGMGFHWSTLQTIFIFLYVSMVYFSVEDFSVSVFINEFKRDFKYVFRFKKRPCINEYHYYFQRHRVGALRSLVFSVWVAVLASFSFEIIWSLLYGFFHFNNLFYPIYFNADGMLFIRNFGLTFCSIISILLVFRLTPRFISKLGERGFTWTIRHKYPFKLKLRLDGWALILFGLCFYSWLSWVLIPSTLPVIAGNDECLDLTGNIVMPVQKYFPQTTYTCYNVSSSELHTYNNIRAWWQDDPFIHFVNVLTKYFHYLLIGYVFIAKPIKRV